MAMEAEDIEALIRAAFPKAQIKVVDTVGDRNHWAAEVIDESAQHAGHAGANGSGWGTHFRVQLAGAPLQALPRIARHRLVYDALRDFIDRDGVHALAIEVRPPAA